MHKYTRFKAERSVKGEGLMDKCELANKYSLFLSGDDTEAQGWLGLHIENGEYIFRVFAPEGVTEKTLTDEEKTETLVSVFGISL